MNNDDEHPRLSATHYCKDCGALWRQNDDFSFNLRQLTCCKTCDNTPVGGPLVGLTELVDARERQRLVLLNVIRRAVSIMKGGEGVKDQGEAWDRTLALLQNVIRHEASKNV